MATNNSAENYLKRNKFKFDLRILKIHLPSEFQLKMSIYDRDNEQKLKNYWNFSNSKEINSAENYSTETKFELDLCIFMTHLCTEFQFKISIYDGDNERKLNINGFFLSVRGITLLKIIQPNPNLTSTCIFSRHIYIPNFNSKCQFVMKIMSGN